MLGRSAGKFFKETIEIGWIGEFKFIADLFDGFIGTQLSLYFGDQFVVDHLLGRKPAVLPGDLVKMDRTYFQ